MTLPCPERRRNQAKGFVWGGTLSGRLKEEKARLLRALRELPGLDSAWFQTDSATDADRAPDGLCGACGRCQCAPPMHASPRGFYPLFVHTGAPSSAGV